MPISTRVTRRRALAGAAALPLVAACGGAGTTATTEPNPGAVRGRIVHWSNAMFPFHEDVGAEFAREFRERFPGIEYETDLIVGDRFEKLVAAAAAGTMPDISPRTCG